MTRTMSLPHSLAFALAFVLISVSGSFAQHAHQSGSPYRKALIDSLRANFRVDPCCASTLDKCLKQSPNCAVAPRISAFIDWLDEQWRESPNITETRVLELLRNRHATFADTKRYATDVRGWPVIGDPKAPITVTMYYSMTCPVCKRVFSELYPAVTSGPLKGKAKIVAKPFHDHPGNRAMVVAHNMGRFADFMLAASQLSGRIDEDAIYRIADNMLFDRNRFGERLQNQDVLKRLEAATAEGEKNGVTHIPTLFISGRKYNSLLTFEWIIDAIEYVHETETK